MGVEKGVCPVGDLGVEPGHREMGGLVAAALGVRPYGDLKCVEPGAARPGGDLLQ
ncbi:hypothetical protein Sm713_11030 [Streptomyces sp. TS71-3]|nr:hypothetical protein Sm713_11030 [Streptomyces sp. TS71-3]